MPNTRKKVIKTVYKDDEDSESDAGDFSDSGSDAQISEHSSSEDEEDAGSDASSIQEFKEQSKKKNFKPQTKPRKKFAKELIQKINRQSSIANNDDDDDVAPTPFSVKDLTDADKLLPSHLNLSESDSSDDESSAVKKPQIHLTPKLQNSTSDHEEDTKPEYKDVWSSNIKDDSEDVAKRTFLELELHKSKIEQAKASVMQYKSKASNNRESNVIDLLALGEELPTNQEKKHSQSLQDDSESEMEDWEEVKETKGIPKQGLQLVLDIPEAEVKKRKKFDVEMIMKRKMNRVKKENQVYMHKVHVLCWLGHGNYVSRVLNDQDILATALSLVPSKECYPGERVDMKYLEQITTWYKDKLTLKQDKNENKFKPKAPPLKEILQVQIKSRVVTTKKYLVFIFISMLRALGLQCRVMFNFVTLPLKPPSSELCSLSTKNKEEKDKSKEKGEKDITEKQKTSKKKDSTSRNKSAKKLSQVDGNFDSTFSSESEFEEISQLDGNDDNGKTETITKRKTRANRINKNILENKPDNDEDVSPPKRAKNSPTSETENSSLLSKQKIKNTEPVKTDSKLPPKRGKNNKTSSKPAAEHIEKINGNKLVPSKRKISDESASLQKDSQETVRQPRTRKAIKNAQISSNESNNSEVIPPKIIVSKADDSNTSKYFANETFTSRTRSKTTNSTSTQENETKNTKTRTKSAPGSSDNAEKSKYFVNDDPKLIPSQAKKQPRKSLREIKKEDILEDQKRISHRELLSKSKVKSKNDVTGDLVNIIKSRVKEAKQSAKKLIVKGKAKAESDIDSDYLPEEEPKNAKDDSDDDFKPTKISPRAAPSTSRKKDRRVLSSDDDSPKHKTDVWCEVFVEELEQWISVDVVRGKVHCDNELYSHATHPVCYIVGWDNNNYLKDLTRRYVPHWNTVTRKQRAEPSWWETAVRPWLGPKNARDREEDEQLNRMQLEAPLPKSISEYKNHPLYALKRHLLKFEAIYPPDAATLGFVRNEPVYSRDCVYVCRSRDIWLKEAKVVRLGEKPYKIVKARPKWDRLSNKIVTGKLLEIFGPWQVQDYDPPVAENGIVPRNAYGNVELFKECMLPKGTVHIKLPGLNRIAKKLNIDCAPAMTGFDFNGGWSHPVYDGFVVCKEFEEIVTEAWHKDQEEQERRELEKMETRVYGNWKRLIKGLLIRERLKHKYGFEEPSTSKDTKKSKGPRLIVKKKS